MHFLCPFVLQVEKLLSDVDPSFVEKFVSRSDLVSLHSFLVTPNCHRVTEMMHAHANDSRLVFVCILFIFAFIG